MVPIIIIPANPALAFDAIETGDDNLAPAIGVSQERADELRDTLSDLCNRAADVDGGIDSHDTASIASKIAKTPNELFFIAYALGYKHRKEGDRREDIPNSFTGRG